MVNLVSPREETMERLKNASIYAGRKTLANSGFLDFRALLLNEVAAKGSWRNPLSVVNWAVDSAVTVNIEPVDSKPMFSKDKTYILFGLTGSLGQSLTQWMVQHGARYIVLTSRNPSIDEQWVESLEKFEAKIKLYSK